MKLFWKIFFVKSNLSKINCPFLLLNSIVQEPVIKILYTRSSCFGCPMKSLLFVFVSLSICLPVSVSVRPSTSLQFSSLFRCQIFLKLNHTLCLGDSQCFLQISWPGLLFSSIFKRKYVIILIFRKQWTLKKKETEIINFGLIWSDILDMLLYCPLTWAKSKSCSMNHLLLNQVWMNFYSIALIAYWTCTRAKVIQWTKNQKGKNLLLLILLFFVLPLCLKGFNIAPVRFIARSVVKHEILLGFVCFFSCIFLFILPPDNKITK